MKNTLILLRNARVTLTEAQSAARLASSLPAEIYQALVGQLLSDGYADKSSASSNTRLSWSFGSNFLPYAQFIAQLLSPYCNTGVMERNVTTKGKKYTAYRLKTIKSPLFNALFDLFYSLDSMTQRYVKQVPDNIGSLMSPVTLAHLIMGDGNFDAGRNRVRIYTNSFTHSDCVRLAQSITALGVKTEVMLDKVGSKGENQYILTIGATQLAVLRSLVAQHMHSSMLYRIGL